MKINHIGYAVKNINRSVSEFEKLGYEFEDVIVDEKRNIKICFGTCDNYRIELVASNEKEKESPVDSYVKRYSNIPYHICYESNAFDEDISELERKGFKTIVPPDTACAFENRRVVFMINIAVGIMEIVEVE